jgi:Rieske Fe-S protein
MKEQYVKEDQAALEPDIPWDEKALSRRKLLEAGFWVLAGAGGAGVAGVAGKFLIGNSLEPKPQKWVEVGAVADLETGRVHRVTYSVRAQDAWRTAERQGVVYALTEDGENFTVFDAICTHLGCSVQWKEEDNRFACPCHAGQFSREGDVLSGPPPRPLVKLETKLEDGILKALV